MNKISPPRADRRPVVIERHDERIEDPYAWLRDERWQDVMRSPELLAPDIRTYLDAENRYAEATLAPTATLQARLFAEIKARIKEDDSTVPAPDGPFAYYRRFAVGGQHPILCRYRAEAGEQAEEILLNGDEEAEGLKYLNLTTSHHSPDHAILAYAVDLNGSEFFAIRFRDLATGRPLDDEIPNTHGSFAWANDSRTVFYTVLDESHRPLRVFRHVLGTPVDADALVYEETGPGFFVDVDKTESGRFIVITAHDHETTEARLIDADHPASVPVLVARREQHVEYDVSDHGDRLIIRTNADGAEDFTLVETPLATPGRAHWRTLVPHRRGRLIVGYHVFRDYLVRLEREDALPHIVVMRFADGQEYEITFGEAAYALSLMGSLEYATDTLRFAYSSMATPERIFDYDMETGDRVLRKEQEIPSGHDPDAYAIERIHATSHDGKPIPVSLLYRNGLPRDGNAPVLLYGYGSYGLAVPAAFIPTRLSLVDRGFIFAIAHIRGGMDRGFHWYREGKTRQKTNTFRDFIAVAEQLIADGYTQAGRIAAQGGSAGGMLVGAVANMRPELFKAIVADVPFVDVLNTMCDPSLPLTPPEWTEWGNPITDPEIYRYIRSYSPYENVEAKDYPNILVTAGLTDPRVTYWEPAKWVARLRARKTDGNLLLLKTNMEAGHHGAAGRFDRLKETAMAYAFLLYVFGLADRDV
jgi:oligopeptidase B